MIAILYRMVGGFVGLGPNMTFLTRVRWAVPMGACMGFLAMVKYEAPIDVVVVAAFCTIAAFIGRLIPHALFQAGASIGNALGMAAIGVLRLAVLVLPYAVTNWSAQLGSVVSGHGVLTPEIDAVRLSIAGFGAFQGMAYYAGWKWLDEKDSGIYYRNHPEQWCIKPENGQTGYPDQSGKNYWLDQAARGGGEWGELLTGCFVYQLAYAVLLVLP